jgi:hypothetical protein
MTDLEITLEKARKILAVPRRGHVSTVLRELVEAIENKDRGS